MRERCNNPRNNEYHRYGARGIHVCGRWDSSFDGFAHFLSDMGEKPSPRHTIDRKDSNKDYFPENCRWATPLEQGQNKRNNHRITHAGTTQTLAQWSRQIGIHHTTILGRLKRSLPLEEVLAK